MVRRDFSICVDVSKEYDERISQSTQTPPPPPSPSAPKAKKEDREINDFIYLCEQKLKTQKRIKKLQYDLEIALFKLTIIDFKLEDFEF